jgi:hypothetical protein
MMRELFYFNRIHFPSSFLVDFMDNEKRKRVQLTKDQKRALADQSTQIAFENIEAQRIARELKTARLKALREAKSTNADEQ